MAHSRRHNMSQSFRNLAGKELIISLSPARTSRIVDPAGLKPPIVHGLRTATAPPALAQTCHDKKKKTRHSVALLPSTKRYACKTNQPRRKAVGSCCQRLPLQLKNPVPPAAVLPTFNHATHIRFAHSSGKLYFFIIFSTKKLKIISMRARTAFSLLATLFLVFGSCICPFLPSHPNIFGLKWEASMDTIGVTEFPETANEVARIEVHESTENSGWHSLWVNNPFDSDMHVTVASRDFIIEEDLTSGVRVLEMREKPNTITAWWSENPIDQIELRLTYTAAPCSTLYVLKLHQFLFFFSFSSESYTTGEVDRFFIGRQTNFLSVCPPARYVDCPSGCQPFFSGAKIDSISASKSLFCRFFSLAERIPIFYWLENRKIIGLRATTRFFIDCSPSQFVNCSPSQFVNCSPAGPAAASNGPAWVVPKRGRLRCSGGVDQAQVNWLLVHYSRIKGKEDHLQIFIPNFVRKKNTSEWVIIHRNSRCYLVLDGPSHVLHNILQQALQICIQKKKSVWMCFTSQASQEMYSRLLIVWGLPLDILQVFIDGVPVNMGSNYKAGFFTLFRSAFVIFFSICK
ncbi:hypothetical protein VP01_2603g1 [Puccinia sorghi]|uniref:Uncharacterized protein n=1 Tax=Puccinia sorghi TaxID=27349 RepID=A0A0L6V583_9BASI|nr:hypothetical protein VP01_2603g1 [Puccinia sorghi]